MMLSSKSNGNKLTKFGTITGRVLFSQSRPNQISGSYKDTSFGNIRFHFQIPTKNDITFSNL